MEQVKSTVALDSAQDLIAIGQWNLADNQDVRAIRPRELLQLWECFRN